MLPHIAPAAHLAYRPDQADADMIARELYTNAGGTNEHGARFRDVQVLLVHCHHLVQERLIAQQQYIAEHPNKRPSKLPVCDVELLRAAFRKAKQRGKQQRATQGADGRPHPQLVRDDPPTPAPVTDSTGIAPTTAAG